MEGAGMDSYEAIVVGTGQAGPSLARRLAGAGWRVAVIERGRFGGTCINTGCTPTKAMVASAYAIHMARRGGEFGFSVGGPVTVDWARVRARKDAIVAPGRAAVERSLRQTAGITVIEGTARFISPHEVSIGGRALRGERIFLDVGGRPSVPPVPGLDGIDYLTSDTILEIAAVPAHLLVLGGSYVGLEFAQIFRRFGAEVTVLEAAPRLIAREDADISEAVKKILEAEGIRVVLGASGLSVERRGNDLRLHFADGEAIGSHLLVATGRRPNTDNLGLEHAGVALDARGFIVTDEALQTSVPGIWALGDCNGRGAFTHTSYNDGEIVAANLLENAGRSVRDRINAYALYTDPPLGRAGMTVTEAKEMRQRVLMGSIAMEDVSRAWEKSETAGMMKVVVDGGTQEILGAAFLGTGGDEAVHCVLDTMYAKAPYPVLQRAMHIHPTVAEFIPSLFDNLQAV
jgi:pyruvate/2-oxoglutarate dehydrogenase complex dihydrolipoamide dehydrogenase (E3) component